MANAGTHAVLTTMLMLNKDNDALNRVGFVGAAKEGATTTFAGAAVDQGTIVKMDKMIKFSGYDKIEGTVDGVASTRSFGPGEGYSWTVKKPTGDTDVKDLWIIDNHEVGYTVEYQNRVTIDPRHFENEAGRAVSCRKLRKNDIIQVSKDAFAANSAPEPHGTTLSKKYVTVNSAGKLVASNTAAAAKDIFVVLGCEPMEFGYDQYDAYILEATSLVD